MPTPEDVRAIADDLRNIARAMEDLRARGAIRSQKLVADLGEWVVASLLGGKVADSKTQGGWDVECEGERVQVRSHAKSEDNPNQWSPVPKSPAQCEALVIVVFSERLRVEQILRVPISEATRRARNGRLRWADVQEYKLKPSDFPMYETLRTLFAYEAVV